MGKVHFLAGIGNVITLLWCSVRRHPVKSSVVNGTLVQIDVTKCSCGHVFSAVARYDI